MIALRVAYVLLLFAVGAIRVYWHQKAKILEAGEKDVPEGWPIWAIRMAILPVWSVGILGWPIHPEWFAFQELPLGEPVRWLGVGVSASGVFLLGRVHKTLGENFSPFLRIREDHQLVETGPYRWVRHPMYTAFTLVFIGTGLTTASSILSIVSVLALIAIAVRTRREEAMLIERFGQSYEEYRGRTGALLPKLF